jgi:putative bacteriocin precursor
MKKLGKKRQTAPATVEAFACSCYSVCQRACPEPVQTAYYINAALSGSTKGLQEDPGK